ncbi:E3 ubiquitin-protein ligase AIRP2-like [Trifolium pratense]|uniref:E3 ubiquitin-protein ligase AIRP2-like n=1 Tax=Trifolium pratense TaxID=57577 RepID=UPI001E6904BC|nr:E3 ubiquitin-protein ligase AIRP2-like [Trifolium pratense]
MVMRKSFKDSLKALEANIQFANTLASDYPRDSDGACFQMRLSYSPAAQFLLFLVKWTDCNLAGALGLLNVLVYKVFDDGKTTMSVCERKATLKEFYGVILPSLIQLQRGITDVEERKQKDLCATKYKPKDVIRKGKISQIDIEREEECPICMEMTNKVVLPKCNHSLCMTCYHDWHSRSQSCPFCRDNLKRVKSGDLWILMSSCDISDLESINKENFKRLFMYIEKLPLILPEQVFIAYPQNF